MKREKTIEVEICDQCGDEMANAYHLRTCSSCKKEMCQNCTAQMSVTITVSTPHTVGVHRAHRVEHQDVDFANVYCTVCGNDILRKLMDAGFVPTPTVEPRARFVRD